MNRFPRVMGLVGILLSTACATLIDVEVSEPDEFEALRTWNFATGHVPGVVAEHRNESILASKLRSFVKRELSDRRFEFREVEADFSLQYLLVVSHGPEFESVGYAPYQFSSNHDTGSFTLEGSQVIEIEYETVVILLVARAPDGHTIWKGRLEHRRPRRDVLALEQDVGRLLGRFPRRQSD